MSIEHLLAAWRSRFGEYSKLDWCRGYAAKQEDPKTLVHHKPWTTWSLSLLSVLFFAIIQPATAASVDFRNCLSPGTINSNPLRLQFTPLHAAALFNTSSPAHSLNLTIYGNVSGQTTYEALPPPNSPDWGNPKITLGKIVDLSVINNKYTTMFSSFNVLSYTPWNSGPTRFCNSSIHGDCPIAPAFFVNASDLDRLPAFSVAHSLFSTYAFTSITATVSVESGDLEGSNIACITATITPDLGSYLGAVLRYLPMAILIAVALATLIASMFSPWGSLDIFRWTSNYGRDEDLLRLVTPGFGDCLQYIQFIVLTGSLSLNYPGFYQPAVSRVGWSSLMFNQSFVTDGNGTQVVHDGIYEYRPNTTYGLDRMSQLVGMTSTKDMWADMIVWLVVIAAAVAILTQLGFAARWLWRQARNVPPEDLRSKNWPFTAGSFVRIVLNYFILPLVSLSMFQLVTASAGPSYSVALAVIVLVGILTFSARLMHLFSRTRPRSFLFDDLLTLLAFGPLYNTYCDDAATFAVVPIFINFMRGVAIGAVQPSGIAQLVLLAICEIILVLTINAFRPFPTASSMNLYHTVFAIIRLVTILLGIAFVPSLGVVDATRGWIGYAILLIHACVLVFGFFLNAVQTLIEVIARLAGAGGKNDVGQGVARGGLTRVFGMRQLSKRVPRREQPSRHSRASDAAMLDPDQKSLQLENARSRSISASSTMLLQQAQSHDKRRSQGFDGTSVGHTTPDVNGRARASTRLSGMSAMTGMTGMTRQTSPGGIVGISQVNSKDPYYRPPRRNTMELMKPPDLRPALARCTTEDEQAIEDDAGEGASAAPPAREDIDDHGAELTKTKTDYAVREVDYYYGVRGPALSSGTRKLRTGPADPTGPVSSATGFFKSLLGGKTKEKNKGFEVVRSARVPPPGLLPSTPDSTRRGRTPEPYHDEPPTLERPRLDIDTMSEQQNPPEPEEQAVDDTSDDEISIPHVATTPPSLPQIDSVGGIELPSRIGSQASHVSKKGAKAVKGEVPPVPAIPRKSSRRGSSQDAAVAGSALADFPRQRLSTIQANPVTSPQRIGGAHRDDHAPPSSSTVTRIPFQNIQPSLAKSYRYSIGAQSVDPAYMDLEINDATIRIKEQDRLREERPSSVGYVREHRASDHIHHKPEEEVGRSAEVFGGHDSTRRI